MKNEDCYFQILIQCLKKQSGQDLILVGNSLFLQWCSKENQTDTIYEPVVLQYKNATMLWPSWLHFSIDWSFKMRYSMNFYLNWYRNYERSELKL